MVKLYNTSYCIVMKQHPYCCVRTSSRTPKLFKKPGVFETVRIIGSVIDWFSVLTVGSFWNCEIQTTTVYGVVSDWLWCELCEGAGAQCLLSHFSVTRPCNTILLPSPNSDATVVNQIPSIIGALIWIYYYQQWLFAVFGMRWRCRRSTHNWWSI